MRIMFKARTRKQNTADSNACCSCNNNIMLSKECDREFQASSITPSFRTLNYTQGMVTTTARNQQELLTLPVHPSSPSVFSVVRVARSLVFCVFDHCILSILRFTFSDYHFGIFKLFLRRVFQFCIRVYQTYLTKKRV